MQRLINLIKALCYTLFIITILLTIILACSIAARAADYGPALDNSKTALLQQTGLQKLQDDTTHYLQSSYIDPYWWTKDTAIALGGGYRIYRTKRIEIKLSKNWTLGFTPNSYQAGWRLPF